MGAPSLFEDAEDKALDNQMFAKTFANGSAGAAGVAIPSKGLKEPIYVLRRKNREREEIGRLERQTMRLLDDRSVWFEFLAGVVPLRRKY